MNDSAGKTASSLAITEKKPHRPGGCVGIFFQLFDWNRRFAKKKLFSKKLLPPARARQPSKKFGGDEKLPKLRLIADENSGGFPSVKKNGSRDVDFEQKHKMQAPSLVARLMGLESMPPVQQAKPKNASFACTGGVSEEKFASNHNRFTKEDPSLERRIGKHELRPQKLQKTGQFERRPVTRFGAEALQFRSVLPRSRKHHPKLVSPVKNSKIVSGRNVSRKSRLIDAAAKILEPGLHATGRTKCALTYQNTTHNALKDEVKTEETMALSLDQSKNSNQYASSAKSLKGQSSCQSCCNLQDVVRVTKVEEQPLAVASPVSNYANLSSSGPERNGLRPPISSLNQERERVFQKSLEHSASFASQARNNVRTCAETTKNIRPLNQDSEIQWNLKSQQCKSRKDVASSIGLKHKTRKQNQMSLGRDGVPPRSKLSNLNSNRVSSGANTVNESKNFVALNRSLSGRTRTRASADVDDCKFNAERKSCNRRDDPVSPLQKRRSMNVVRQGGNSGFVSTTMGKQRSVSCDTIMGEQTGFNSPTMNCTCIKSRLAQHGESKGTCSIKGDSVISFTFNSPMKHKMGITTKMEEKRRDQDEVSCNSTPQKNSDMDDSFQKPLPLTGDALGALLEQKLKELTCQQEEELATGGTQKKTTAMILQELISALTVDRPVSHSDVAVGSIQKEVPCSSSHVLKSNMTFQATTGASVSYSHDGDHLSPGSVLDASFSNDSCFSGSHDDNSGHRLHPNHMECSYDESQPLEPDADLLDSATSLSRQSVATDLLNRVSGVLHSIYLADTRIKGSKLAHAKEVILNTELMSGSTVLRSPDGVKDFPICRFLLDELETLASLVWTDFSCFVGFDAAREWNQLGGLLFDCVIEYLDSAYSRYSNSGLRAWTRLPLCMDAAMLIRRVVEEIRRWSDLAGLIPDELIEREMSRSLGKWTDFEIEAYETGAEFEGDILQILVDEVVVDLWEYKLGSSGISESPF